MGSRGPLKAPPQLQIVRGDPRDRGKSALAAMLDEQIRPRVEIPAMPGQFEKPEQLIELPARLRQESGVGPAIAAEARLEWERVTPHLEKLGLISELDRAIVSLYCFWWAVSTIAQKKIMEMGEQGLVKATPSGFEQMSAWLLVASKATGELTKALAQLGLSPAARSRVTPGDPQAALPGMDKPQEGGWGTYK